MLNVDHDYTREAECEYKGERYKVRDNGAILRMARLGKQKRPKDDIWTFGETVDKGYAKFCGESVHRIVAFAFLGEPPTKQHVVDHIDTNRQNNRPDNLRWLTKLENILLNSITKAKIEYLFGSVDEFLKDPSRLKGHDGEDSNFSWMRAVSPQEAKNTLANWERLLNKPRPVSRVKGNAIEEWIFNKNHSVKTSDSLLDLEDPFDFHQGYEVAELEKKDANASEVKPETSIDSPASPYAEEKEHAEASSISKRVFMSALINICERVGVQYVKYYKSQNWKSDVLIRIGDQRIAISAFPSVSAALKILPLIEKDGIKGCGLVLSPRHEVSELDYCFGVYQLGDVIEVTVGDNQLTLDTFIEKLINDKIFLKKKALITAVDVMFCETECYHCGTSHSVFFPRYLIAEDGKRYDTYCTSICCEDNDEVLEIDLQFGDEILGLVKEYVSMHPEKGIIMGQVKERHSRTMDQDYMSFGCPECDSIVGDYYLNEIHLDYMYETDEKLMNRIQLKTPFEIPINEWLVK